VLVYDGDCGFCTRAADWAVDRLPVGTHVVASHELDLSAVGLTLADVQRSAWWLDGDRRAGGHESIARCLIAIGGRWRLVGRLLFVPPVSWIAAVVYRLVARFRHRMPGGTAACRVDER
jgi:predicted DCC family thiol-disulfide oxidoreductase YuxK